MVEALMGMFETQIAWLVSPLGIGFLVGGLLMIGSGLLGRIVLVVERELQIRSDRRRRRLDEAGPFLTAAARELSRRRQA
jgi:hypothetical protein